MVGEQNCFYLRNARCEELCPHIRPGIDQEPLSIIPFNHDRGTGTAVARLSRVAGPPIPSAIRPANQWNACRTTTAKNRDLQQASTHLLEQGLEILRGQGLKGGDFNPAHPGQNLRGMGDHGRFAALAAEGNRRKVGRIGFD